MFIIALIFAGSLIMIGNIYAYYRFIRSSNDVMLSAKHGESLWQKLGLVLLIFFLLGYLFVAFLGHPDLMTSFILFFGAIFVTLVLMLMFYLVGALKDRSIEVAETLIGVIEARDPNLNGHSRNVQRLCMCMYDHLPKEMKSEISAVSFEYAALLHDVGKLGVPEDILNKPAALDEDEWVVMRKHPRIAMRLLKSLPSFDEIKDWILYHHERADGKGYYGIRPEEIPLAARIIAVCDTYSSITMERSYKKKKSYEEACAIISEVAGTQLDAEIVKIFLSIPKKEITECAPEMIEL